MVCQDPFWIFSKRFFQPLVHLDFLTHSTGFCCEFYQPSLLCALIVSQLGRFVKRFFKVFENFSLTSVWGVPLLCAIIIAHQSNLVKYFFQEIWKNFLENPSTIQLSVFHWRLGVCWFQVGCIPSWQWQYTTDHSELQDGILHKFGIIISCNFLHIFSWQIARGMV